eukprot:7082547-Pyramimonas_sp.AAC.1
MDVDDLRATLDAAGIPAQPTDDAEMLRGKIRKMQTSYLSMCKRQKPSAETFPANGRNVGLEWRP